MSIDRIAREFRDCDDYFVISAQHTFVDNRNPYIGFIRLLRRLHAVVLEDGKARRVNWIVDEGEMPNGVLTQEDARKFDNIQRLRARLLALVAIDKQGAAEWTFRHARIFVRTANGTQGELDLLFGDWIPEAWVADRAFCAAFGDRFDGTREMNINAFWRGDELTCFAVWMDGEEPRMEPLPHPGAEYTKTLAALRAQESNVRRDILLMSPADFVETY